MAQAKKGTETAREHDPAGLAEARTPIRQAVDAVLFDRVRQAAGFRAPDDPPRFLRAKPLDFGLRKRGVERGSG